MITTAMTDKVKLVLSLSPEARASDQELYKGVMTLFYKEHVISDGNRFYVEVADGLPQQQDISRVRRKIQGNGLFSAPWLVRKERQRLAKEAHCVLDGIQDQLKNDLKNKKL